MENNRVNDIKRGSLKIYNKISKPLARQTENTISGKNQEKWEHYY